MNHENAICYCINSVEPNYGPLSFFASSPKHHLWGYPQLRFIWVVTSGGAPDSSNLVRGLDDRPFILVGGAAQCSAAGAATYSSACKERSVFSLTVMTPHGPGILSLR